ncbi:MAG TPA: beta-ketoacyl-ACP synthase III [Solirubrobacterales bacterium]|jgi:3-oxoacyl-[acyl-carrier-protein] synthase-3
MLDTTAAPEATERTAAPEPGRIPAAFASIAMAVPERVEGNAPIAERIGVEENWIVERTGVRERRVAADDETLLDFATGAARGALERAGLAPADVDLVLAATMSHDRITPNLGPLVAAELGTPNAGALDVGAACNGFLAALAVGAPLVETGRARAVLVVGADLMTRIIDHNDRSTAALFADGAGAAVIAPARDGGRIGPVLMGSDGARGDLVVAERAEGILRMEGQDTFREAVARLTDVTRGAAEAAGVELEDIDAFIYHQANARILRAVGQRLKLPAERVVECISTYGNTSAASVPIALARAVEDGRVRPGSRVLLAAFGGGLTWGATVVEWEGATDD